jgi:GNAT superfamily N-acetyltransferase
MNVAAQHLLSRSGLAGHPIVGVEGAEILRQIRNTCREWLHDAREITPEAQADWLAAYTRTAPYDHVAMLIYIDNTSRAIGYVYLRFEHYVYQSVANARSRYVPGAGSWEVTRALVTVGLIPQERGKGYGVALYRYARALSPYNVWAIIKPDNHASRKAALQAGYDRQHGTETDHDTLIASPLEDRILCLM